MPTIIAKVRDQMTNELIHAIDSARIDAECAKDKRKTMNEIEKAYTKPINAVIESKCRSMSDIDIVIREMSEKGYEIINDDYPNGPSNYRESTETNPDLLNDGQQVLCKWHDFDPDC